MEYINVFQCLASLLLRLGRLNRCGWSVGVLVLEDSMDTEIRALVGVAEAYFAAAYEMDADKCAVRFLARRRGV